MVFLDWAPSDQWINFDLFKLGQLESILLNLMGELASIHHDDGLYFGIFYIDFVQDWDQIGSGFACTVFCSCDDWFSVSDEGYGLFLDGGWFIEATFSECQEHIFL